MNIYYAMIYVAEVLYEVQPVFYIIYNSLWTQRRQRQLSEIGFEKWTLVRVASLRWSTF